MNKDALTQRWEAIGFSTNLEASFNELLALNAECVDAGSWYTDFQVASKFVHLLQTCHDIAYIHLLTELARTGVNSNIRSLWYIAQITYNELKINAARPPLVIHHLGMSAYNHQGQGRPSSSYKS
jgi:hypothetical protein